MRWCGRALNAAEEPAADNSVYRLAVLTAEGAAEEWRAPALRTAAEAVLRPLLMSWHSGAGAAALMPAFAVTSLPGAVLLPPFCVGPCAVRAPHRPRYRSV